MTTRAHPVLVATGQVYSDGTTDALAVEKDCCFFEVLVREEVVECSLYFRKLMSRQHFLRLTRLTGILTNALLLSFALAFAVASVRDHDNVHLELAMEDFSQW